MSNATVPIDPSVAAGWLAAIDGSQFVLELDLDGSIVRVNARLCAALGYVQSELIGRRHRSLIVPGTHANASAGEPHRTIIYRARDGREVVVRASITPIPSDGERPARSLVIGVDVSERAGLRAKLDRQAQGPGRSDRLPNGVRKVLDQPDCLFGAYHVEAAVDAVAVANQIRECANFMRPAAEAKGLVLRCAIDPELPALVVCDRLRLRQIVMHLIGNAVRFTDAGWISICAEPAWDDPRILVISVTDTGSGMATAEMVSALGSGDGDDVAGPRVGLAVSAEIARQMGGVLTLASRRGRGTRAELRFPMRPFEGGAEPLGTGFGYLG